jgi:hypothetical protein
MILGSKHSEATRAKFRAARSPNGACRQGHERTPENTGTTGYCKICKTAKDKRWQRNHPAATRTKARLDSHRKSARIGAYVVEYKKNHPCVDCGESDYVVLVFDHREPSTKRFRMRQARSWKSLKEEIDKCDVRCCNCHARRHAAHG